MKIAFVFISMPVGGAEDFAIAMQENFPAKAEARFVCLRSLGELGERMLADGKRIDLVNAAPGKRWSLPGVLRLARWLKAEKVDLVHSQTYHAHTYAIVAARLAGCASVLHQQKTLEGLPWRRFWTLRVLTRMADRVVALSEKTARDLTTSFALSPGKVRVIPNAVDAKMFFPSGDPQKIRATLGLPGGILLGAVASLNQVKNHEATLAMAARLKASGFSFHLIFVGEGKQRADLTNKIADLGLGDCVRLVGNQRPVAPWMQALDVLLLPSHWEGQPMVLLQALACGIPVVASAIEGNIAALGKEHPGLFPPGDIEAYVNKVREALENPQATLEFQARRPPPLAANVARDLFAIYRQIAR